MSILENNFRPYPCQQFTLELNDILSIFGEIVVTAFPFCHHIPCIAAAQINERIWKRIQINTSLWDLRNSFQFLYFIKSKTFVTQIPFKGQSKNFRTHVFYTRIQIYPLGFLKLVEYKESLIFMSISLAYTANKQAWLDFYKGVKNVTSPTNV